MISLDHTITGSPFIKNIFSMSPRKEDGLAVNPTCSAGTKGIIPSEFDVLCGRGNISLKHMGNKRLRYLVEDSLRDYARAKSKIEKSVVVSRIIDQVADGSVRGNELSHGGMFLRKNNKSRQWEVVSDRFAREKVGQLLRDALHDQYRSSTASKKERRRVEVAEHDSQLMSIIGTNPKISSSMHTLSGSINDQESDATFARKCEEANRDILEELKQSNYVRLLETTVVVSSRESGDESSSSDAES